MQKVIILTYNYEPTQFPTEPDSENRFYTYGFGACFGNLFNKYLKQYKFEVWRIDSYCKRKYYEKEIDGLKFKVFRSFKIHKLVHFSYSMLRELREEIKRTNPLLFIVHTHNWQTYQILFCTKNAKKIVTNHGDWSPFFVYNYFHGKRKLNAFFSKIAERKTFYHISYFLICDHKHIQYLKKVVHDFRYKFYSTGVEIDKFKHASKSEQRKELGWSQDKKYILYVGKLYKYKQVGELLELWKEIKTDNPEVELVLVGNEPKGSWGEEYYEKAEQSGAMIIGRVLNIELYKYYCAADVYVMLGLRDDMFGGMGIAPLESLACNTPVVTNSLKNFMGDNADELGENPSTIEEYKQAIIKVLNNPSKYKNMRESVDKYYSWEAIAKRTDKIFKEVLNIN